jgi:uncharacterized membrane protein
MKDLIDSGGMYGAYLHYIFVILIALTAFIAFIFFWSKGQLNFDEEAKLKMMEEKD